ncbi:MAG: hypothetical protein OEV94_08350, partial [Deltaproteobacteria bacterium]|nr:hypothetical protein [Deltaproteobacteria bacterium]
MIAFTPYLSWLAAALCVGAAWLAAPWLNRAARSPGQPPHPWEPATAPALALMGMLISLGWPLPEGWPPGNLWPLTQPLLYGWTGYLIAVVDLREMEVDLRFVTAGILLRLAWLLVFPISGNLVDMVGGMLMGAGGLYWVGVMYQALRGRQGLGDGDAA